MAQKPAIPRGTRDFLPTEMTKRNYIFNTIRKVFEKYGYGEVATSAMENLATLTGKYGDEGDQLIFKILNSGDYLSKVSSEVLNEANSKKMSFEISEKALRYDLTVPLARLVVMRQNDIQFPFKRYQIQPVWRADRPQKGRYREFYQCDVDVLGSESLLNEAEFIAIYDEVLSNLGLTDFTIKINNRKILYAIAELLGKTDLLIAMTVAVDKLDKIGWESVNKEMEERGFSEEDVKFIQSFFNLAGSNEVILDSLKPLLAMSTVGMKGVEELQTIFEYLHYFNIKKAKVEIDLTLARGLNYYTGAIFEVKTNEVTMGSIGGGGRYDDLTGMFGLKGITGVGVSIGAERIYDVLEELALFPTTLKTITQILVVNFGHDFDKYTLPILSYLRSEGIATELYPSSAKLAKQMKYADDKKIPYVLFVGEDEVKTQRYKIKKMANAEEKYLTISELIAMVLG